MHAQIAFYMKNNNPNYRLYSVSNASFPSHTYIICSDATRKVLFSPHIAGKKLQDAMEDVSVVFAHVLKNTALSHIPFSSIVEFILLAGGLYYNLNYGFKRIYNKALQQCFLGIKRQRVEGTEGQFTAVSTYENFESLPDNATVLIGDTIATGATIVRAIGDLRRAAMEKGVSINNIVILSLACSSHGAMRIRKLEEELNANIWLFASEEFFHLMPDGTDLRFLREDAVVPDESKEYILSTYGKFLSINMKCAVFDWGTRCKNPRQHYKEFLDFAESTLKHDDIDNKTREILERMANECKRDLSDYL